MTDTMTVVYFKGITRGFSVPSVLTDFSLFGIPLHVQWYGVIIAFGFLLAVLFGGRIAYKWKINLDKMLDVLIYGTIFGILGARLYYVIFQWENYAGNIASIFKIWEGGLAIYGGLIGGLLAAYVTCKVRKLNFRNLLDMSAMSFLIGQGIGRWGNFTNQEAFGTNTNLPWGMWSEKTAEYINSNQAEFLKRGITVEAGTYLNKAYVHPTFLYESLWCLLGFAVLYIICRKFRRFSGQIMLCYGVWYGAGRAVFEGLRTDSLYLGNTGLRASQILSAALALACLAALIILMRKYKKHPQPIEGVDFFPEEEVKADKKAGKSAPAAADVIAPAGEAESGTDPVGSAEEAENDETGSSPPDGEENGEENDEADNAEDDQEDDDEVDE